MHAEPEYADELVEHAKQMLEFGTEHPGTYMKSKLEGLVDQGKHYPSSGFNDELSWGAIWLYFATGVSQHHATRATMAESSLTIHHLGHNVKTCPAAPDMPSQLGAGQ